MNEEGCMCDSYCVALSNWPLTPQRQYFKERKKKYHCRNYGLCVLVPKTDSKYGEDVKEKIDSLKW